MKSPNISKTNAIYFDINAIGLRILESEEEAYRESNMVKTKLLRRARLHLLSASSAIGEVSKLERNLEVDS